jgi:hypothetical protein
MAHTAYTGCRGGRALRIKCWAVPSMTEPARSGSSIAEAPLGGGGHGGSGEGCGGGGGLWAVLLLGKGHGLPAPTRAAAGQAWRIQWGVRPFAYLTSPCSLGAVGLSLSFCSEDFHETWREQRVSCEIRIKQNLQRNPDVAAQQPVNDKDQAPSPLTTCNHIGAHWIRAQEGSTQGKQGTSDDRGRFIPAWCMCCVPHLESE